MKWLRKLAASVAVLMAAAGVAGCSDEPDRELYFLGDSIMEFWDVRRVFPMFRCYNYGKAGEGIDYLAGKDKVVAGRDVALIIGTNDCWQYLGGEERVADYTSRYIQAVNGLRAKRVYLFCVFPRNYVGDSPDVPEAIVRFNASLRGRLGEFVCEVEYIDPYDRLCLGGTRDINPEFSPDALHLNQYGYEILADELLKRLK